jgi:hypothetical protein
VSKAKGWQDALRSVASRACPRVGRFIPKTAIHYIADGNSNIKTTERLGEAGANRHFDMRCHAYNVLDGSHYFWPRIGQLANWTS